MVGLIIGLLIGTAFGFVACAFVVANDEQRHRPQDIDGFNETTGDEWNTDVEDIDEP